MTFRSKVTTPLGVAVLLSIGLGCAAIAAPSSVDRAASTLADGMPVAPVAATDSEEDAASCSKSRKRLWIEGEGWVVRKVLTCR